MAEWLLICKWHYLFTWRLNARLDIKKLFNRKYRWLWDLPWNVWGPGKVCLGLWKGARADLENHFPELSLNPTQLLNFFRCTLAASRLGCLMVRRLWSIQVAGGCDSICQGCWYKLYLLTLQICGGIYGGEDAWGGDVHVGGRSHLPGAVQQRADDWRGEVGQCQTWTKYKAYVDTSRLMEESLRTASTILMATTRLWATRLSLMGSLSSERCYFLWVHPEVRRMYHILFWEDNFHVRAAESDSGFNFSPGTRNHLLQHLPRAARAREDTKGNRQHKREPHRRRTIFHQKE